MNEPSHRPFSVKIYVGGTVRTIHGFENREVQPWFERFLDFLV